MKNLLRYLLILFLATCSTSTMGLYACSDCDECDCPHTSCDEDYCESNYILKSSDYKYYLSLCAIFRDEADYLKEWIEYNKLLGVEHFYLYNNLSIDHYLEVLQPYIDSGEVELFEWDREHSIAIEWGKIQCDAYRDVLKRSKKETKWLAIFDTDEFIVPSQHETLADLIRFYEQKDKKHKYARYEIQWVVFGTSGIYRVPEDKLMIELLTKNSGVNKLVKSIVRPEHAGQRVTPHVCHMVHGKKAKAIKPKMAVINHYMYRDGHFLHTVKIPRREKIGNDAKAVIDWEATCCEENVYSLGIFRFVDKLREQMGMN